MNLHARDFDKLYQNGFRAFSAHGFTHSVFLKTISRRRRLYWLLSFYPGNPALDLYPCWFVDKVVRKRGRKFGILHGSSEWSGDGALDAIKNSPLAPLLT
jgi:hypothetical protein